MSQATPDIIAGSTAPGGSTIQASEDAHKAAATSNSGTSKPSYSEAGTPWFNTTDDVLTYENNAGSSLTVATTDDLPSSGAAALPADDTTPSVLGGGVFEEVYTTPTTVTALDDGVKGDKVTIMFTTSNMTVGPLLTKTGMTIPCIAGDVMEWTHNGTTFKQTGGTVGMNNLVMLDEANAIGDWISSSIDSFTDVDVSDDGVRKGATMAVLMLEIVTSSGSVPSLRTMRKGGTSHTGRYQTGAASAMMDAHAALDNNGVFQAKFASSWSSSQNIASVVAYYI